jgi:formate dehydrogenase major subunit
MTNHWIDLKNSDCILIMGSNAAENHPISFKYVTMAQQSGGKVISVDPRFTRTSSKADIYAPLRSGTDIAFLGGMIKYILDNKLYNEEYVSNYTNAPLLLHNDYGFKDGLFSGYDPQAKKYDKKTWGFQTDEKGIPKRDVTLKDPRCVFNILKDHYNRYDLTIVSKITGTPEENLLEVYKTFAATGEKGKAGTVMYAMGWTQHSVGVQNIRAMSIIQSLLANMGIAGGGINALRGEGNVQGSTDQALLWHIWPGYTNIPTASVTSLDAFLKKITPKTSDPSSVNWKQNYPKYAVSMLKSFFGENATKENEFGYQLMPKPDDGKSYSWLDLFDEMYRGSIKGFFAWGMNPACSGANAGKTRKAMAKLDWMVNVNLFDNETGSFWKGPGMNPSKIKTEVFMLPAAVSVEKEGSITNSGRWMQWRYQGPKPLGNSKPDGDIIMELGNTLKEAYKKDGGKFPDAILKLKWDYMTDGKFDPHKVAKEINGYFLEDATVNNQQFKKGDLVPSFAFLQADGKTSSGDWVYSGSYTNKGNMAARRSQKDAPNNIGLFPEFAWAWPVNRRIIYNRASVNLKGRPNDEKRWVVKYTFEQKEGKYVPGKWEGDVPDGAAPPFQNPDGTARTDGKYPFIMQKDGFAAIFGPGLADGPLPEHYEPLECPVEKNLMSSQLINPTAVVYCTDLDTCESCNPRFPYIGTTYRVSEHWQTGLMTRPQAWLLELQPQVFVEMSEELAKLRDISNGERVKVFTVRGSLECTALVTKRFKPMKIGDCIVHEVGMPYNYGWRWPVSGKEESPNLLTPSAGDPNTRIPESKAFMVNISKIKRG